MTMLAADDSYLWDFAKERKVPTISPSGSLSLNNHYYSGLSVYLFWGRARLHSLRKNSDTSRIWEGHDFGRAANSLAPGPRFSA
jgi:hypothetical protein